jgi:hypothetical protein
MSPASTTFFAYLDPGSGAVIIQMIVGGVAALGVMIKVFWRRIRKLLGRNPEGPQAETVSRSDTR